MPIRKRLAVLGGGDAELLEATSGNSSDRYMQMGIVLICTSAVSGIAMWFAVYDAVLAPPAGGHRSWVAVPVAAVLALGWALLILNLDRLLIVTMNAGGSIIRLVVLALPRLALALIIGAVVATPLTLRLFQSDIEFQLGQTALAHGETNKQAIEKSPEQHRVDDLRAQIAEQRGILEGILPVSSESAQVRALKAQLDDLLKQQTTAQHASDQADILVQCERYGGHRNELDDPGKCAARPGPNGNYPRYLRDAERAAAALDAIDTKVADKQAELAAAQRAQQADVQAQLTQLKKDAPQKLRELEQQMAAAEQALDGLKQRLAGENLGNNGLLARLEALDAITAQSQMLKNAHRALWALFASIELLPVLTKVLSSFGSKTAYDEALALREAAEVDAARMRRASTNQIEKGRIDARIEGEADMRRLETELTKEGNQRVAQVMREVMNETLDAWKQQVRASIAGANSPSVASPPGLQGSVNGHGSVGSPVSVPQPQSSNGHLLPPP